MFTISNFQDVYLTSLALMSIFFIMTKNKPARNTSFMMILLSIIEIFIYSNLRIVIPKGEVFIGMKFYFWVFIYRTLLNVISGILIYKVIKPNGKKFIASAILIQIIIYFIGILEFLFPNNMLLHNYYSWYLIQHTSVLLILNIFEVLFLYSFNIIDVNFNSIKIFMYRFQKVIKKYKLALYKILKLSAWI